MGLTQEQLVELRQRMETHLTSQDVRKLCFDLNVSYDDLPGDTRDVKIIELLKYLQSRKILNSLINYLQSNRSDILKDSSIKSSDAEGIHNSSKKRTRFHWTYDIQTIGAILGIIAAIFAVLSFGRDLFDIVIPSLPPTTTPTQPTITPKPNNVDLFTTENYTYSDDLFTISQPKQWDVEQPEFLEADKTLRVRFTPPEAVDIYWLIMVDVIDLSDDIGSDRLLSASSLRSALDRYLQNYFSDLPGFNVDITRLNATTISARWSFRIEQGNATPIPIHAESRLTQWGGGRIALVTIYLPREQFERQEEAVAAIFDSLTLNINAPFPQP